ncbi:hypothetical protein [Paenibacillus ehimensis]|uniref:FAS1 domain-containing protein n=1 Tax=Paenibacillus ehimensis TaxID=79264 RepID=A0ABT8VH74_9BACL|nr:hypothetical protein [Paenibacillus ehimensis]MDO3680336.1 hypothetical protein [Paenibacillus ehimensis]MEC0211398.1 hypothetical protein [Paenibacillus ehimensis]
MGIFDLFKKNQQPQAQENDLIRSIRHAIGIMENTGSESHEEIIERISHCTKDERLAWELYCLIPSVYCRMIIKEVQYSNEMIVIFPDDTQQQALLSDNQVYKAIQGVVADKFSGEIDNAKIQNILFQSSEFNAINNALNDGSSLEDLMTGPLVMFAPDK